jgi:polyisoprenoid-binding protein YceI
MMGPFPFGRRERAGNVDGGTGKTRLDGPGSAAPDPPPRKRHWLRWIVVSVVALAVITVGGGILAIRLGASAPPLALPGDHVTAPAGPVDGTWDTAAGSVAGFRAGETTLGIGGDVSGRTDAVTGALVISGGQVIRAVFRVDLASITIGGKTQSQLAAILDAKDHPIATVALDRPVTLPPAFASGEAITVAAAGHLTLRGISQPVTLAISARRDGTVLQATGSIPVAYSRWHITPPEAGIFGSFASQGIAEFLLILHQDAQAVPGGGTAS